MAGKYVGTVFPEFTPTFDLVVIAAVDATLPLVIESARHIDDALHRPERTFPSFIGKTIPGEYLPALGTSQRPLHRLIDSVANDSNRTAAGRICDDVWGSDGRSPNLNCDEYPFASTYEGAYTSTSSGTLLAVWNGSARLINGDDNQTAGRYLNTRFYTVNRILDSDPFFVESILP